MRPKSMQGGIAPGRLRRLGGRALLIFAMVGAAAPTPADDQVRICFNLGCHRQAEVLIKGEDWTRLQGLFDPAAASADAERARIAEAIALLERIAGRQTPTWQSRAFGINRVVARPPQPEQWPLLENTRPHPSIDGQMDCIDHSTNSTRYLELLARHGWLHWYRPADRVFRAPRIFDQHWAAQIEEIGTGHRYAVDSWQRDNGEPPVIQPLQAWEHGTAAPEPAPKGSATDGLNRLGDGG